MTSKMTSDLRSASLVRTNGLGQSGDFLTMTNSEIRTEKNRNAGLCNLPADPELDHEETSRQRSKT